MSSIMRFRVSYGVPQDVGLAQLDESANLGASLAILAIGKGDYREYASVMKILGNWKSLPVALREFMDPLSVTDCEGLDGGR